MCRRGFIRYLYDQLDAAISDNSNLFTFDKVLLKFQRQRNVSFHLFTTHSPCGDASIFPSAVNRNADDLNQLPAKKPKLEESNQIDKESVGSKLEATCQNFTGAKLVCSDSDHIQDLMIQSIGAVRRKPGRGDPTLSMSCSDKLAKWNILGIQGALIHRLLDQPIYLESITFCDTPFCNIDAMQRTLRTRFETQTFKILSNFQQASPQMQICHGNKFEYEKNDELEPCPNSIVWCKVARKSHEVSVAGKRQGITKKKANTRSARLLISKMEIFRIHVELIEKLNNTFHVDMNKKNLRQMSYYDAKCLSTEYQQQWNEIKEHMFGIWAEKPKQFLSFLVD